MISYRAFKNSDPPRLLALWNQCVHGRSFGVPTCVDPLEQLLFSKPYFDRRGLIFALDGERVIGFIHVGFGARDDLGGLDRRRGVICMIMVHPGHRRRGVATELLRRGEQFLRDQGAEELFFGPIFPSDPFYFGLYGGSELPGLLESNIPGIALACRHGYQPREGVHLRERILSEPPILDDNRLPLLRRQVEIVADVQPMATHWWQACQLQTYPPVPTLRYEMLERGSRQLVAHAWAWDMIHFSRARRDVPTVGLFLFEVEESRRRHGFGLLLLLSILRHLAEQQFNVVEAQTRSDNVAAIGLCDRFKFQHVDTGRAYVK